LVGVGLNPGRLDGLSTQTGDLLPFRQQTSFGEAPLSNRGCDYSAPSPEARFALSNYAATGLHPEHPLPPAISGVFSMKPFHDITDPTVAKALAHPLRTRLLSALEDRTASPSELAAELDVPLGVLSYHIRRLTALGFLKLVRRVPRRGAVEHYYTATVRPPVTDEAWGATPGTVKQASIAGSLGQLGTQVSAAAAAGGFNSAEARISQAAVTLDDQGWRQLAFELAALATRVEEIENESRARLDETAASPHHDRGVDTLPSVDTKATAQVNARGDATASSQATDTADPTASATPRHEAKLVLMLYEDPAVSGH
jgi:DNA-binding transcriptional ArsR family regulator